MTNNLIKQFLDAHDYDVRRTHNGRWIDQKCIYDEVCFVSDCIVDYLLNGGMNLLHLRLSGIKIIPSQM